MVADNLYQVWPKEYPRADLRSRDKRQASAMRFVVV